MEHQRIKGMMTMTNQFDGKTFTAEDHARLASAAEETQELKLFIGRRYEEYIKLMGTFDPRFPTYHYKVDNPFTPVTVKNEAGEDVQVFKVKEDKGGDQHGVTYNTGYVPVDFVFQGEDLERKIREAQEALSALTIPVRH